MEYNPPPLFRQGLSALVKVVVFSLFALCLLLLDSRTHILFVIREVVSTVLYPLEQAALSPRQAWRAVDGHFTSVVQLEKEILRLESEAIKNAVVLDQVRQLAMENAQLRSLLGASQHLPVKSIVAEILYDAKDPYTRKIIIDRGAKEGVVLGQAVVDEQGVLGQVTRVLPLVSEVTLLTDKDQLIPVMVERTGLRAVVHGRGQSNILDVRFVGLDADIVNGDFLVTSGIDGVYPAGLRVAQIVRVEKKSQDMFSLVWCRLLAGVNRHRQVLVLFPLTSLSGGVKK